MAGGQHLSGSRARCRRSSRARRIRAAAPLQPRDPAGRRSSGDACATRRRPAGRRGGPRTRRTRAESTRCHLPRARVVDGDRPRRRGAGRGRAGDRDYPRRYRRRPRVAARALARGGAELARSQRRVPGAAQRRSAERRRPHKGAGTRRRRERARPRLRHARRRSRRAGGPRLRRLLAAHAAQHEGGRLPRRRRRGAGPRCAPARRCRAPRPRGDARRSAAAGEPGDDAARRRPAAQLYADGDAAAGVEVVAQGPGGTSTVTKSDAHGFATVSLTAAGPWRIWFRTGDRVAELLFEVPAGDLQGGAR